MNGTVGPVRVITRTRTLRWRSVRFRSGPDRGSEPNLPITMLTPCEFHPIHLCCSSKVCFGLLSFVMFTPKELTPPTSSAIIQDIMALQDAGQATIAYFYFDSRDIDKQDLRTALSSLLTQLSAYSDSYCDILSHVHQVHINGAEKSSVGTMITCFKEMLALPDQGPVYIILDALDECPNP